MQSQPTTLADYLKTARTQRGQTLRGLAKSASVRPSTITRIESGESDPRASTLGNVIRALRLSKDEKLALVKLL